MKQKLFTMFLAFIATNALLASNVINYTATAKLTETQFTYYSGLYVYAFNVSITSHSFSNGHGTITFAGEVTKIGDRAFKGCSSLTSVTIPNSVTSIGYDAFHSCSGLTSITIPNSVESIGSAAFYSCSSLKSVTLGDSVKSIGGSTFAYCSKLTSITIPNSLDCIQGETFYYCIDLTSVKIGNSVKTIGENAFCGCSSLTSVTIGNSVTSIGNSAFYGCSRINSISLPNSVTSIGSSAFYGCSGILSITIPTLVESIGSGAFYMVTNIEYYGTATGSPWGAKSVNGYVAGYLVYKDSSKKELVGCSSVAKGEITIPNSVTSIGSSAFRGCSDLTSVTIGNSVKSIGSSAFYGCSGITFITLPNSITSIGVGAFRDCSSIKSVIIPDSITSIESEVFYSCDSLEFITLGNAVTSIGKNAFSSCTGPISVMIENPVTNIGEKAFYGCSSLTSVTIGNSVKDIGEEAFRGCSSLASIIIPNSVTNIGTRTFYNCTSLASAIIGNSVTSIGVSLFEGCSSLTSVTIPNSVISISDYAFRGCHGLTSIAIPNSVKRITFYAFTECSRLSSITIPNSVTDIGSGTFSYCSGLKNVIIGNSVKSIGGSVFTGCSSLTSVTMPNSVTSIKDNAFDKCTKLDTIRVMVSPFEDEKISSIINNYFKGKKIIKTPLGVTTTCESPTCATIVVDLTNVDTSKYAKMSLDYLNMKYTLLAGVNTIFVTGLKPDDINTLDFHSQLLGSLEWREGCKLYIQMPKLELTTLQPKVTALGEAIVYATTNISEVETKVGFEWRKYDAPATLKSSSAFTFIYNGSLQGKLKNLNNTYYNVRAFYESADSTRYYGDWVTFDPTDFSYFDPEVHTYYLPIPPTTNNVTVKGLVTAGTDDITEQGFEYWPTGTPSTIRREVKKDVVLVPASGQLLSATISGLQYSQTYECRAFAKTAKTTIYGEQINFTTPEDPRPIYELNLSASEGGSVQADPEGTYREGDQVTITATANDGYAFVQWSDKDTTNPRVIIMNTNITLQAIFELSGSAVEQVKSECLINTYKILKDGQFYILRDGKMYNAQGGEL